MRGYGHIMQRCAMNYGGAEEHATVAAYMGQMADLDTALQREVVTEQRRGMAMAEALDARVMEDEGMSRSRNKARKMRRKKNDFLSKAIFKAKRSTASSMRTPVSAPASSGRRAMRK